MKLPTEQAKVLADLSAKDAQLCELQAAGVAEDDPRFMEAREEYAEILAAVEGAGIPEGDWFLLERKGQEPVAFSREAEVS